MHAKQIDEAFGAWRSAVHAPPSAGAWQQLMSLARRGLREWPQVFAEQWAPYAAAHLRGWPVRLRVLPPDMTHDALTSPNLATTEGLRPLICFASPRCQPQALDALAALWPGVPAAVLRLPFRRYGCAPELVAALLEHPAAQGVLSLGMRGLWLGEDAARLVARAPALYQLERLDIRENGAGDIAEILFQDGRLRALRSLRAGEVMRWDEVESSGCSPTVSEGVMRALAQATHMDQLEALELLGVRAAAPETQALLCAPHLRGLRRLSWAQQTWGDAPALAAPTSAPGIIEAIADAGLALERLTLGGLDVDAAAIQALNKAPSLRGLRALGLSKARVFDGLALELLARDGPEGLEELVLSGPAQEDVLAVLAGAPFSASLRRLEISSSGVSEAAVEAMASLPQLRHLRLSRYLVDPIRMAELARAAPQVRVVTNNHSIDNMLSLVRAEVWRCPYLDVSGQLERLLVLGAEAAPREVELPRVNASGAAWTAWLASPMWRSVERLCLPDALVSAAVIRALGQGAEALVTLHTLDLSRADLRGMTAAALRRLGKLPALKVVHLRPRALPAPELTRLRREVRHVEWACAE